MADEHLKVLKAQCHTAYSYRKQVRQHARLQCFCWYSGPCSVRSPWNSPLTVLHTYSQCVIALLVVMWGEHIACHTVHRHVQVCLFCLACRGQLFLFLCWFPLQCPCPRPGVHSTMFVTTWQSHVLVFDTYMPRQVRNHLRCVLHRQGRSRLPRHGSIGQCMDLDREQDTLDRQKLW